MLYNAKDNTKLYKTVVKSHAVNIIHIIHIRLKLNGLPVIMWMVYVSDVSVVMHFDDCAFFQTVVQSLTFIPLA